MEDKPEGLTLDELLQHSQIVSVNNGRVNPKLDNLKRILETVDRSKFTEKTPVAILAILGSKSAGKSFLTNFLVQYFRFGEHGGWMSEIKRKTDKGEPMMERGFSWDGISHPNFYQAASSGIYLWPEPFLVNEGDGREKVMVWIMHLHTLQNELEENVKELEKFLVVACSRIMEITKWKNENIRIFEQYHRIVQEGETQSSEAVGLEDLCRSVVFVIRTVDKKIPKPVSDKEAKTELVHSLVDFGKQKPYLEFLDKFQHVDLAWMKNSSEALHGRDGVLNVKEMKMIGPMIKKVVETMTAEAEIEAKIIGGKELTFGGMHDFLINTAEKVNSRMTRNVESVPIVSASSSDVMKIDKTSEAHFTRKEFYRTRGRGIRQVIMIDRSQVGFQRKGESREAQTIRTTYDTVSPPKSSCMTMTSTPTSSITHSINTINNVQSDNQRVATVNHRTALFPSSSSPNPKIVSEHNAGHEIKTTNPIKQTEDESELNSSVPYSLSFSTPEVTHENNSMEVDDDESSSPIQKALVKSKVKKDEEIMEVDEDIVFVKGLDNLHISPQEIDKTKLKRERMEAETAARKLEGFRKAAAEKERKFREMNQARSVMEQTFHITIRQLETMFVPQTRTWIEKELNLENVNQIEAIYNHMLNMITQSHRNAIHPKLWNEFVSRVDDHCKSEFRIVPTLKIISEALLKIKNGIKIQFEIHHFFEPTKLDQIIENECSKAIKQVEDGFILNTMIKRGTEKLASIFKEHNKMITEAVEELFEESRRKLSSVYQEQMKRYMKHAPYSPKQLQEIHESLMKKLAQAFKNAFSEYRMGNNAGKVKAKVEALEGEMIKAFEDFKRNNDTKLSRLQREITKIMQNIKTLYHDKVEEVFKQNQDGLDTKTLVKLHNGIQTEVTKLLEMEIKQKVRPDEPLDSHKQVLKGHIESYWPTVEEVNKKTLQQKQKRDEVERKKQMEESRKSGVKGASTAKSDSLLYNTVVNSFKEKDTGPNLPPLVFHLQSSRTVMATHVGGHIRILNNEFGESETPSVIVFTPENGFVYGINAFLSKDVPESMGFRWNIGEFFLSKDFTWKKTIFLEGDQHVITIEFMLAFLLTKLKQAAESELNGQFKEAVLAIPFWLSSTQRIMLKDAATMAGFSKAYLINEASAAAYNFVLSKSPFGQNVVMVISENLDHVDAFVYEFYKVHKRVRMIAHSCNYELDEQKNKSRIGRTISNCATSIANYISSYFSTAEQHKKDELAEPTVRDLCKVAVQKAWSQPDIQRYLDTKPSASLFICENVRKWGGILGTVVRDFARNVFDTNEHYLVLRGAVALSQNVKEIGECVRDKSAYDILRLTSVAGATSVMSKDEYLPVNTQNYSSEMKRSKQEATYYQNVRGNSHEIAKLLVEPIECTQTLEPRVEITNEGIVRLKHIFLHTYHFNLRNKMPQYVDPSQYKWITPNLTVEELEYLTGILEQVAMSPKHDPVLLQAKSDLLAKCQEMVEKITNGEFKIKSQLVKDKVLEQIRDAEQFANHENSGLESVEKHMGLLEKLYERYSKK